MVLGEYKRAVERNEGLITISGSIHAVPLGLKYLLILKSIGYLLFRRRISSMSSNNSFWSGQQMVGVAESWRMQGLYTQNISSWVNGVPPIDTPYTPASPELELHTAIPTDPTYYAPSTSELETAEVTSTSGHYEAEGAAKYWNGYAENRIEEDTIDSDEENVRNDWYFLQHITQPVGLSPMLQSKFGNLADLINNGFRDHPDPPTLPSSRTEDITGKTEQRQSIWNDPSPKDQFSVLQEDRYLFSYEKCVFYVEGGRRPNCSYTDSPFSVRVEGPSNIPCFVNIEPDMELDYRYICTFSTKNPGVYTGHVKSQIAGSTLQVIGSPFQMSVSRKYDDPSCFSKTIAAMEMKSMVKFWGICVDGTTNKIYLADRELHTIHVYDCNGGLCFSFGEQGREPGQFMRPTAIVVDPVNHRLVISDKDNHRISFFKMNGEYISSFGQHGQEDGNFRYPWGVDVSKTQGWIVVADSRNKRIQLFDNDGNFLKKFCTPEPFPANFKKILEYPRGVVFSKGGLELYVTDLNLSTVIVVDIESTCMETLVLPANKSRPQGLAVDNLGNILVCDSREDCIRVFSPKGELLWTIQEPDSLFNGPLDVAVTSDDRLVFVDNKGCLRMY